MNAKYECKTTKYTYKIIDRLQLRILHLIRYSLELQKGKTATLIPNDSNIAHRVHFVTHNTMCNRSQVLCFVYKLLNASTFMLNHC